MIVKIVTAELLYKGDNASKYLVTVQTKEGKPYAVYTWSKAIGEGVGKEFDVQSEKRKDKFTNKDQNFIKQVGAGSGGNGAWRKSADNSVATALNCACMIHAAQIRQGIKYSPDVLVMADNFLTWMKAKE